MRYFENLRITRKIAIGFGLAILSLFVVSAAAIFGLGGAAREFSRFSELAALTHQLGRVQANFLEARLGVENYLVDQSQKNIDTVIGRLKTTMDMADQAKSMTASDKDRQQIDALIHTFEVCGGKFSNLTQNQKAYDKAMADLDKSGGTLDGAVPESAVAARQTVGATHLAIANFLRTHSEDDVDQAMAASDAFKAIAAKAGAADLHAAMGLYKNYMTAFDDVHEAVMARDDFVHIVRDQAGPRGSQQIEDLLLGLKQAQDALEDKARGAVKLSIAATLAISAVAAAVAILSSLVIGRGIANPVVAMTALMQRLAAHDLSIDLDQFVRRHDEVGQMAVTLQNFRDGIGESDRLAREREAQQEADNARARHVDELTGTFKAEVAEILSSFTKSAQELTGTSGTMSEAANKAADQAAAVSAAAAEASRNVETVAAATEQMAASIGEIGRQTAQAHAVTMEARADSERANAQIAALADAAARIGEVVSLITDIASQTNLLALNATIEAARAGDAGKGFAVVANEVKQLASQTQRATEDITQQVTSVQSSTRDAVDAIDRVGRTVGRIHEISAAIAASVEEQGAATQSIAGNIQKAGNGTREVTDNVAGAADSAKSTGVAAGTVLGAATALNGQCRSLHEIISKFLSDVATAESARA